MARVPNEEKAVPLVPDSYVPPRGDRHAVKKGETWVSIANASGLDPWDLIDFNFPGTKRTKQTDSQRAMRQVNWYLREYVGCKTSLDGENWAFDSGLIQGKGVWKGGVIYTPAKTLPPPLPLPRCSPTSAKSPGRRPTFYRLLTNTEKELAATVFQRRNLPSLDTIGIGDGLLGDGYPWTDMTPMSDSGLQMSFEINLGDAARADLTTKQAANCFTTGVGGTVSDLFIHEMTHVWQYHNRKSLRGRFSVGISSFFFGHYDSSGGDPWDSYDVEHQASIVEKWYHDSAKPTHILYPYIQLVVRAAFAGEDALRYAGGLTLNELNRDLADLRSRGLDR